MNIKKTLSAISAAVMCAVPMINGVTANAAKLHTTDYLSGRKYYREIWFDSSTDGVSDGHWTELVGDVNGDWKINAADIACLQSYLKNKKNSINRLSADIDGNGYVEEYDVTLLQQYDAGLINHFKGYQAYYNRLSNYNKNGTYRVYSNNGGNDFSAVLVGDINNDGKINICDSTLLSQCLKNGKGFNAYFSNETDRKRAQRASDINNDGHINQADVKLINAYDAGTVNFDDFS